MKILLYTDPHIRDYGSFPKYNTIESNGLTGEMNNIVRGFQFVRDKIIEYEPDFVFLLGDVYHSLEYISSRSLHMSDICLSMIKGTCDSINAEHFILAGNHDIYSESSKILSISNLRGYGSIVHEFEIRTLSKKKSKFRVSLIPYTSNGGKNYESLLTSYDNSDIILTHLDFQGAKRDNFSIVETGLSPVSPIDIYTGHIHMRQKIENVNYIGSLVQNRFTLQDLENVGGVVIIDTKDKSSSFYPNTYSKHYVKLTNIDKLRELDPKKVILKIITDKEKEEIDKLAEGYDFIYIKQKVFKDDSEKKTYLNFNMERPESALRNYVAQNNPEVLGTFDEMLES